MVARVTLGFSLIRTPSPNDSKPTEAPSGFGTSTTTTSRVTANLRRVEKKTQKIDFQFTANFEDFKSDAGSVLGFWREGAPYGDFGTQSFGSYHASGEITIDCCKKGKSIKLELFNRWSTPSLTRNRSSTATFGIRWTFT